MKIIARYLDDLLLLAGCICILIGLVQWIPIVAWIVGGLMLVVFGVMVGKVTHVD